MSRYLSVPFDENKHPIQDVQLTGSNIPEAQAIPYHIVKRKQTTIQTHNQVSVGASGGISDSAWIDCLGFEKLAFTVLNDAAKPNHVHIWWSNDGINNQGITLNAVPSTSDQHRAGEVSVMARYVKIRLNNGDTVSHIMSAWAYLKT